MLRILLLLCLMLPAARAAEPPIAIAIHAGAGVMDRGSLDAEAEAAIRISLALAVQAGHQVLAEGGSSLDAVIAAVTRLEDDPRFNAGRGAVLNAEGGFELDAALMISRGPSAGAVAGVRTLRHPILLARAVMEQTPHVLLSGDGAEAFADTLELERVGPEWFRTPHREAQWQRGRGQAPSLRPAEDNRGTVGAVALDRHGMLAAATSTGGMSNKRWGRVGDSPIIGAGTYADARCAVSATGHGEYFIRAVVAHEICARARYREIPVAQAAAEVMAELAETGGDGGVISMDAQGRPGLPFNTSGMYRAAIDAEGNLNVAIYADENPNPQ